jgi:hypothetical protein
LFTGGEVDEADLSMDGLFIFSEFLFLSFGKADGVGDPARVGGEEVLSAKGDDFWRSAGKVGDAEFKVATGVRDAIGKPFAIG